MNASDWGRLVAGISIFLFAMYLVEDSLKVLAGRPFKKFLQNQTSNKIKAIAGGAVVTAALQSSSVVLLMVLSFVGAGIMTMRNALAVTFGANLGSTISGWIVALVGFKVGLDAIAYPLLALFLLMQITLPLNKNIKSLTQFFMGFALIFIGLEWMKESVTGLLNSIDISRYANLSPYLFIPAGVIITVIIQSSAATMAITLTALHSNVIPFESAAGIIIGSELGTSLKLWLGAVGGMPDKKRVAIANIIFNFASTVIATVLLHALIWFIRHALRIGDPLIGLVSFQTIINILAIIAFYPFIGKFADALERFVGNGNEKEITKYIHPSGKHEPGDGSEVVDKEMVRLLVHTIRLNRKILMLESGAAGNRSWVAALKKFALEKEDPEDDYKELKLLHGKILVYLGNMEKDGVHPQSGELSSKIVTISQYVIRAGKNIKDIQHNLDELRGSANDVLHKIYQEIRTGQKAFYKTLNDLMISAAANSNTGNIETLLEQNRTDNQTNVENGLALLNNGQVTELDSSTLVNVFRELYSSNKALLKAVEGLAELRGSGAGTAPTRKSGV
jgi:phosphate:Na+ symporter